MNLISNVQSVDRPHIRMAWLQLRTQKKPIGVRHGNVINMAILDDVVTLTQEWDMLQYEFGLVAIDRLDPLLLAIAYSQNIGERFRNF